MNEELDSQLSAMFDDELPAAECELMARRLSRDEDMKARWGRYAAIGATIRAEGGVRLNSQLAVRVNTVISAEPAAVEPAAQRVAEQPVQGRPRLFASRMWVPVGGAALAAGVAAAAILWVRFESPGQDGVIVAQAPPAGTQVLVSANPAPSYVVPKTAARRSIVPATQLANYVVAHSEFSSPVNRRNLLSALMANESGTAGAQSGSEEPNEDASDDATSPQ